MKLGGIQSVEFSPWNSVRGIQSVEFSPWNSVRGIQSVEFSPWNSVRGIQSVEFSRWNSVHGIQPRVESQQCPSTGGPPTRELVLTDIADSTQLGTRERVRAKVGKIQAGV